MKLSVHAVGCLDSWEAFPEKKKKKPEKPKQLRTKQLIIMKHCDNQTTRAEKYI